VAPRPLLATVVTDKLRSAIMDAELRLGEALSEDKLAASFGVSRTPIREALTALQMEGLIVILPQRGSFVFSPSAEDIQEMCEFRAMAESRALTLSLARNKQKTLRALKTANRAMESARAKGDGRSACQADAAFHMAFFDGCGNQFLARAYFMVAGRIGAMRANIIGLHADIRSRVMVEHDRIIQAFADGDAVGAEAILAQHVLNIEENYASAKQQKAEKDAANQGSALPG
jgi:DNA-binding GntR family transcriptional regulator